MIDKFSEIPKTRQGLSMFILQAEKDIKRCKRKIENLNECITEARNQLGNQEVKEPV